MTQAEALNESWDKLKNELNIPKELESMIRYIHATAWSDCYLHTRNEVLNNYFGQGEEN